MHSSKILPVLMSKEGRAAISFCHSRKTMKVDWQALFVKLAIWLLTEMCLGWMGLDTLADYSEFLQGDHEMLQVTKVAPEVASSSLPDYQF